MSLSGLLINVWHVGGYEGWTLLTVIYYKVYHRIELCPSVNGLLWTQFIGMQMHSLWSKDLTETHICTWSSAERKIAQEVLPSIQCKYLWGDYSILFTLERYIFCPEAK